MHPKFAYKLIDTSFYRPSNSHGYLAMCLYFCHISRLYRRSHNSGNKTSINSWLKFWTRLIGAIIALRSIIQFVIIFTFLLFLMFVSRVTYLSSNRFKSRLSSNRFNLQLSSRRGDENEEDDDDDEEEEEEDPVAAAADKGERITVVRRPPPIVQPTAKAMAVTRTIKRRPLECYVCAYKAETPLRACLDPTKYRYCWFNHLNQLNINNYAK